MGDDLAQQVGATGRDLPLCCIKKCAGYGFGKIQKISGTVFTGMLSLDSCARAGVAGIKIDFMNSEAKDLIDFETGFLAATARRKLMVNFHGCQAPTGESITYPNEMTREGIRGMELNIMKEPIPAWHNAALPFTRFYVAMEIIRRDFFRKGNTTYTHQLALLYLFNSPFQSIAENPVTLLD